MARIERSCCARSPIGATPSMHSATSMWSRPPEAWARLEGYLRLQIRSRLTSVVQSLTADAAALQAGIAADKDTRALRGELLRLRSRYTQVETILDFYGDAVNTRTNPKLAAVLRGLDVIAGDSLDAALKPLGLESPPVLVYLDKGLGAVDPASRRSPLGSRGPFSRGGREADTSQPRPSDCTPARGGSPGRVPDRMDGRAARRAQRGAPRGGRGSSARCGRRGPARSLPTCTRSSSAGGRRSSRSRTSSTARRLRSTGSCPATRIPSRSCGSCSTQPSAGLGSDPGRGTPWPRHGSSAIPQRRPGARAARSQPRRSPRSAIRRPLHEAIVHRVPRQPVTAARRSSACVPRRPRSICPHGGRLSRHVPLPRPTRVAARLHLPRDAGEHRSDPSR